MKNVAQWSLALALTVSFLPACSENNAAGPSTDKSATEKVVDAAKGKFEEVKASFTKLTDTQMGEIGQKVDDLKKKASSLTAEKKTEIDGLLQKIGAKKDELAKMLGEMKGTGEGSAYDGIKTKLESGIAELKKLVESATSKLK